MQATSQKVANGPMANAVASFRIDDDADLDRRIDRFMAEIDEVFAARKVDAFRCLSALTARLSTELAALEKDERAHAARGADAQPLQTITFVEALIDRLKDRQSAMS